jgi:hypothetical protein
VFETRFDCAGTMLIRSSIAASVANRLPRVCLHLRVMKSLQVTTDERVLGINGLWTTVNAEVMLLSRISL